LAGSRANLDVVMKRKFPVPAVNRTPVVHPIVSDCNDCQPLEDQYLCSFSMRLYSCFKYLLFYKFQSGIRYNVLV
jgi:hypothetical protein